MGKSGKKGGKKKGNRDEPRGDQLAWRKERKAQRHQKYLERLQNRRDSVKFRCTRCDRPIKIWQTGMCRRCLREIQARNKKAEKVA